ncbi:MAG: biofilm PGA synthesis lipoprotein PgaB [Planctomycetota bacterium]|jgi:biofilm PGA synthesis lipoprotein PgaB
MLPLLFASTPLYAAKDAVILMYHNVAEDTPPSTSVTPQSFRQHMQFLADNNFNVWPLMKTLTILENGGVLPPKTVVITFDDAYQSVYSEAFPVLKSYGWPFTVFVTTNYISGGYASFMNWQQLREIENSGAEIGNHSASHSHFIRKRRDESNALWRARVTAEINEAQAVLRAHLERPVMAHAYPYGEHNSELRELVANLGFFGLGQNSGAVSHASDFRALSRFPMATGYDLLDDFALKISTRALPVTVLAPDDGMLSLQSTIPELKLRLNNGNYKKSSINCFASGQQGHIKVDWSDQNTNEIIVRANDVLNPGRTKYTCTAPSKTETGVFYWFSFLWMKPALDGSWYRE